jgi:Zn-dependent peptidase ImmA (M78 family)
VARVPFQSRDLEAASLWEHGAVPVILLNGRAGRAVYSLSRRATLAHELCHLLHDGGHAEIATRVSLSEDCETREYAVEQRARAFAPAFLAPPEMVRTWVRRLPSLSDRELAVETASHWGFSYQGAVWHLKNCGLVDAGRADALSTRSAPELPADQFEAEAAMGSPDMPVKASALMEGWAARLVSEALSGELISAGRARELLEWG